jgi:hypothetical protein
MEHSENAVHKNSMRAVRAYSLEYEDVQKQHSNIDV